MWKVMVIALLSVAASASATAVIYLPVQYEFGGVDKYFYGGHDPLIIARAERDSAKAAFDRAHGVTNPRVRVYSDLFPYASNATIFGFSVNDARNAAYQSLPRYFRMSDIRPTAHAEAAAPAEHRSERAGSIEIKPYKRPVNSPAKKVIEIPASTPSVKSTVR
jgi:hypothetical protein